MDNSLFFETQGLRDQPIPVAALRGVCRSAVALAVAWLALGLSAAAGPAQPLETPPVPRRPNILLILGDYMGYGDLGCYGAPDIRTPNLDRLGREGVRLTDAYSAAPVCTPARIALLTGRYPARTGIETNVDPRHPSVGLPASEITIARMLRDAGYATGMFGKWHLGYQSRYYPTAHGFQQFLGILDWTVDYYSHRTDKGENGLYENNDPVQRPGYITDLLSDEAIAFIERHREEPFFVYLTYNAALPPCQPPGSPGDVRTEQTWNSSTREDYVKVVESLDAGVGRVLSTLERLDLAGDTLVIFTYDHGGRGLSRSDPLFHGFATLWEGGIRVPCLMRWPGRIPAGRTVHHPVISMDLTASMLAAAGVQPAAGRPLDGIDLLPLLRGEAAAAERTFFWRIDFPNIRRHKAVRRGRWKYLLDVSTGMLFDLEEDIGERSNRSYQRPDIYLELRRSLAEWEATIPAAGPRAR